MTKERNYGLKTQLKDALFEVMQPHVRYSCSDLREAVGTAHPELVIEDRKFSTLLYRIRKDKPEIIMVDNMYMVMREGELHMEEAYTMNESEWNLTKYIDGINSLVAEAEAFCKRDITDTSLPTQQVIAIRCAAEITKKLKKIMREKEKCVQKALSEINVLNQLKN